MNQSYSRCGAGRKDKTNKKRILVFNQCISEALIYCKVFWMMYNLHYPEQGLIFSAATNGLTSDLPPSSIHYLLHLIISLFVLEIIIM